jgi:hypothetical protein
MLKSDRVKSRASAEVAATDVVLPDERHYTQRDRIKYLALIALSSLVLLIARLLRPSPRGLGTHQQLGLPPCPMLYLTGWPCPSCGLTTSFAHAARFDFYQAFITQPFGLIAFSLTILSIPLSLYLIQRRVAWADFIHARGVNAGLYALIVLYLLGWIYKLFAISWLPTNG